MSAQSPTEVITAKEAMGTPRSPPTPQLSAAAPSSSSQGGGGGGDDDNSSDKDKPTPTETSTTSDAGSASATIAEKLAATAGEMPSTSTADALQAEAEGVPAEAATAETADASTQDDGNLAGELAPTSIPPARKLAEGVAKLVASLEPWKGIMPSSLIENLEAVGKTGKELQGILTGVPVSQAENDSKPRKIVEIERLSMNEHWNVRSVFPKDHKEVAVLKVYYQKLGGEQPKTFTARLVPSSLESGPGGATNKGGVSSGWNIQRVRIESPVLAEEFERLVGRSLNSEPIIVCPPFKILIEFLPDLEERLEQLKLQRDRITDDELPVLSNSKSDASEKAEEAKKDASEKTTGEGQPPKPKDAKTKKAELAENVSHFQLMVDFIRDELHDVLDLREKIAAGTLEKISFEDLWHLYQPGTLIMSSDSDRAEQLEKVFGVSGGSTKKRNRSRNEGLEKESAIAGLGSWTPFLIDCFSMNFDGQKVGAVNATHVIEPYSGERAIQDLRVYPLRFHRREKERDVLRRLKERGTKLLKSYGHKMYEGLGATVGSEPDIDKLGLAALKEHIECDVFIDLETFWGLHLKSTPFTGPPVKSQASKLEVEELIFGNTENARLILTDPEVDDKLTEDFFASNHGSLEPMTAKEAEALPGYLQLLPPTVAGYSFRFRKWVRLRVDTLKEIDHQARGRGFDDLVIPKRYRDLLVALVNNHASGTQRRNDRLKTQEQILGGDMSGDREVDLVKGKGQGLILLLHGPPGSGKTSTAETIAAFTKRPLYSLTCGDIGLSPESVERNLQSHTGRADKWGCVLLLDEADVFLMKRDWTNIERNALVSVFLRELEYYSGILFLTTNRPGVIDEAFKSRIHITLRYPAIDLDTTRKMWRNIMRRLEEDNAGAELKTVFDQESLLEFAEKHFLAHQHNNTTWNGRQIRNAFRTALALGNYDRLAKLRREGISPEQALAGGPGIATKRWMRQVKLTKGNFKNIAKTSDDFEAYIRRLRGSDSQNARDEEARDDEEMEEDGYVMETPAYSSSRKRGGVGASSSGGGGGGGGEPLRRRGTATLKGKGTGAASSSSAAAAAAAASSSKAGKKSSSSKHAKAAAPAKKGARKTRDDDDDDDDEEEEEEDEDEKEEEEEEEDDDDDSDEDDDDDDDSD